MGRRVAIYAECVFAGVIVRRTAKTVSMTLGALKAVTYAELLGYSVTAVTASLSLELISALLVLLCGLRVSDVSKVCGTGAHVSPTVGAATRATAASIVGSMLLIWWAAPSECTH
jgi:hypothetical protein